ncbi:hypothetical protein HMPREF9996_02267 [Aggregatibacter actinomycetemcomitans Y4]|nr:hypothetical protein HMPREF9996_02267 [Aggregatibacter actinomycetemcomitans Y4]
MRPVATNSNLHCRIGSLEIFGSEALIIICLHCRIGSLEIKEGKTCKPIQLHCRIGSLEISNV